MNFQDQLIEYVQFAFDNEREFIDRFADVIGFERPNHHSKWDEIGSFYMAGYQCTVSMINVMGFRADGVISTDDYIAWCEEIKDKQNE